MLSKETRKLKTHIMLTQIINGKILTPQGWLKDGSVLISDSKILEVTNCDLAVVGATLIDAKGMYTVPGGVEIHVHGGGGRDCMEGTEEAFHAAVATHMKLSNEFWKGVAVSNNFFVVVRASRTA